ncbi:MAG: hypothetical protein AB7T06_18180 [Kofleriaceae bacterium]
MRWTWTSLLAVGACMPSYSFDRAPLPEPTQSQQAACYRAKRYQLLRGDAEWRYQRQSGDYLITEYWAAHGIAFRRGDTLVDAVDAIDTLPDPDLVQGYRTLVGETEGAHRRYPFMRDLSLGLAFGGLGISLVGLGLALADNESELALPVAIGGAGVALLSIIPLVFASQAYKPAIQHDLDRHLYRRAEWAGRMYSAVERYNQQVAQECGHAPADVPMTPGAESLIRSSVRSPQAPTAPPPPPPLP